jgi:Riboflavin kinase
MTAELITGDSPDGVTHVVIDGIVEHGDERGRQLGFPTANVHAVDGIRFDGVYAGTVQIDPEHNGSTYVAAVSVGQRPTYYGKEGLCLLEANLLDYSGDLYGQGIRITLRVRLRPQHKYVGTPALVRQLHGDVEATRAWALANGLDALLRSRPAPGRGRHRVGSAGPADRMDKARARTARRTEAIARAVLAIGPGELTHEWVAQRAGIPLGYLTWRFANLADLRALAGSGDA